MPSESCTAVRSFIAAGFAWADSEYQAAQHTADRVFRGQWRSPQSLTQVPRRVWTKGKISPEDDLRKFVPEMRKFV